MSSPEEKRYIAIPIQPAGKWAVRDAKTGRIVPGTIKKGPRAESLARKVADELNEEEKYENELSLLQISRPKKSKKETQGGNIFAALFGAVALVGVLAAGTTQFVRGPLTSTVTINKTLRAEQRLETNARIILQESASALDCDLDGLNEPLAPTAGAGPIGGGFMPNVPGTTQKDPWGTPYGYCAWDHGTTGAGLCGDLLTGTEPASGVVIALVSAGPDRTFDSTCGAAPSFLTKNGDDVAEVYTPELAQLMTGGAGIWKLVDGDDTKTTTEKDVALDSSMSFSSTGSISMGGGSMLDVAGLFFLPDQNELAACNGANIGSLRRQSAPGSEKLEICNGTAWVPVGARVLDELDDARADYVTGYSMYLGENVGAGAIGDYNTAMGAGAFSGVGDGIGNAVYGAFAGGHTTGDYNTFIGYQAGDASTGNNNTYLGKAAGYGNMGGYANTFTGFHSGYGGGSFGDGFGNAGYGYGSLFHLTYGNYNTALGWNAGSLLETGSNNIYIGNAVYAATPGENYKLNIGNLITGDLNAKALTVEGTGALKIPSGTTAQQPTGISGMIRFNTTSNSFEGYNGTAWSSLGSGGGSFKMIAAGASGGYMRRQRVSPWSFLGPNCLIDENTVDPGITAGKWISSNGSWYTNETCYLNNLPAGRYLNLTKGAVIDWAGGTFYIGPTSGDNCRNVSNICYYDNNYAVLLKIDDGGGGGGTTAVESFTDLDDVPPDYTGHNGKIVAVNSAGNGLEFKTDSTGATAFTALTDAPASYTGHGGKFVAVNSGGTALEFVAAPSGGGGGGTLSCANYTMAQFGGGMAGKVTAPCGFAGELLTGGGCDGEDVTGSLPEAGGYSCKVPMTSTTVTTATAICCKIQ